MLTKSSASYSNKQLTLLASGAAASAKENKDKQR